MKIPAMKTAVRQDAAGSKEQLVKDLDNEDPAVRLYAIGALQRLTGRSFGYRYYVDGPEREEAIGRWKQWLAEQPGGRSEGEALPDRQPATQPSRSRG